MTLISIRERAGLPDGHNATVSFDNQGEYPIAVADPFSEEEEQRLGWYFEEHLNLPFVEQVKAREAAASVEAYGEALFKQVFADRDAYARYTEGVQAGLDTLHVEIAGSPEFHRLHWEALKDPSLPRPLAVEASMVRRNLKPQPVRATVRQSPTINILVVTARPGGGSDVGYRTISRPLIEGLRQANLPVNVEILRPGTYEALAKHLEEVRDRHGAGYYHVVHFDVHGALLTYEQLQKVQRQYAGTAHLFQTRYGRDDIEAYEGRRAYLFLEGQKEPEADPVEAAELADLLISHQVPVAILNACQSGKQVGSAETSLGSRLMQAGVQMVLAMGYSVTVTAAALMMRILYEQLFAGRDFATAIRRARLELYNRKGRRARFNQTIDLEDWLLPVVYQNQELRLAVRDFTPPEKVAYYERRAARHPFPQPTYGFFGRDLDILRIEKRLLSRRNLLLIRGMGGAGKTTLLHHLAAWWQTTQFVDQIFYFGYDERAWTREQIVLKIAQQQLTPVEYAAFQPLKVEVQQTMLAERLRAHRHLLILDNLESVTGAQLAIQNTLPPEEQAAVRSLLADLVGGRTLVLLGSRGGEKWLMAGDARHPAPLREDDVYDLPGLDPEAASALADGILARHGAARYREDPDFLRLLKLLDGYPLALEVVLMNLSRRSPSEVLAGLQAGDVDLDAGDRQNKTESILRCVDYSYSNLSAEAQGLLLCLAPFSSVFSLNWLKNYTAWLREQPALVCLPLDGWATVLTEAASSGLVSPHPAVSGAASLCNLFSPSSCRAVSGVLRTLSRGKLSRLPFRSTMMRSPCSLRDSFGLEMPNRSNWGRG